MIAAGAEFKWMTDDDQLNGKVTTTKMGKKQEVELAIPGNGGALIKH